MTLNDKEIIHKLKIERDYLEAKLHKVNKALEAFGDSNQTRQSKGVSLKCDTCKNEYIAKRKNQSNYCSFKCRPSTIAREEAKKNLTEVQIRNKTKPTTLVKGDALSH